MRTIGVLGTVLALVLAPGTARAATSSFTATADAYVTSKSPNANFGLTTDLRADANPVVRSYLRFDPAGLSGPVRQATLRLYAANGSSVGYQVRGVPGNPSFGETTITYNNAPAISSTVTGSSGAYGAGWTAVDITALVTGAVPLTLAVTTTANGGRLNFSSRQVAAQAPQLEIVTDTTPPGVTLSAPADGSSTASSMPVFAGAAGTDLGDSTSVTVKVYSGPTASGVPIQTLTTTRSGASYAVTASAPLLNGTYTAQAQQSDDAGLTGFSSANTFVVDTVAPAITLTTPAHGSATASRTPTFSGAAGTATGDSATVTVKVYAGPSATGTPVQTRIATRSGSAWSVAASPALADGVYTAQAEQADAAGNVGLSSAATFTVDGTAPVVTLTAPANGSAVATATPTFSGGAGTASGDATTVLVHIYAGSSATGTPVQTLSASASGGLWTASAGAPLADGVYTAQAEQSDGTGNVGRSAPSTFTVDTQAPPAPAITSGPPDPSSSASATFGFTDSETGVGFRCRVDGGAPASCTSPTTFGSLAEGAHVFGVSAVDAAGNASAEIQWAWAIDTAPPAVTVTSPSDGSASTETTPVLSGAAGTAPGDAQAIVVTIYPGPTPSGTPVQTLTTTRAGASWQVSASAPLADGTYTAEAAQADAAGNVGRATSTFTVDTTAPAVTLTAPASGDTVGSTPVFSGAAGTAPGDSSTVTVRVYAGSSATGTPVRTLTATRSGSSWSVATSPALADAVYTAQAEQADAVGHTGLSTPNTFTVDSTIADTTPPAVTLTTPAHGAVVNQRTPAFAGAAGDAAGDNLTVTVKVYSGSSATGSPLQTLTTTRSGATWLVVASSPLSDGTYTARAEQGDAAGNLGRSSANTFAIEATAPVVTLTAPPNGSSSPADRPTFRGAAGTAAGDSSAVTVKVYSGSSASGSPVQTLAATQSAGTYAVTASSPLSPGLYTARAEQGDAAGNTGFSSANTFTVTDPVFIGAGDIADCTSSGDEATAALLDANPDALVYTVGDNVYPNGTVTEFTNCYDPSWGRAKTRTRPTLGDHDYGDGTNPNATGYMNYFQAQLAPFGAAALDPTRGWYSYDVGAWHVAVVNADCGTGDGSLVCSQDAQEQWLRSDLAVHPNLCNIAIVHEPRWSSGSVHGNTAFVQRYWQAAYDNGVDVVLSGSDHIYERFALQDGAGNPDTQYGVREFIVGTGGASHYGIGTIKPNSEVRGIDTYGLLKLTLHATGYDWQFIHEAGKTFTDSGSQACHGPPPPPSPLVPQVRSVASNAGNSLPAITIDKPSGTLQDDLLVAIVSHQSGSNRSMTPPAGWTAIPGTDVYEGTNAHIHAWYHLAGGSEPGSYTFTLTGGDGRDTAGGIMAISGANLATPINASGGQSNGSTASTSVPAPSITTTVANTLLLYSGSGASGATYTQPGNMFEQFDRTTSGTFKVSIEAASQPLSAGGATGTRTALASTSVRTVAVMIAIAPR